MRLLTILFILSTSLSFGQVNFGSLLDEMVDRDELAKTPEHAFKLLQSSSYDRASVDPSTDWFANGDGGGFIRTEVNSGRTERVIMDDTSGPGAIVRFWGTFIPGPGNFDNGTLRFYFDGSSTPAIEAPFLDIISGDHLTDGILSTRTGTFIENGLPHSGVNLYVPIPYANGCKVTYEGTDNPFYYAINYREYDNSTTVQTFSMQDLTDYAAKLDSVEAELETNAADVTAGTTLITDTSRVIAAGATHTYTINDLDGEAIRQLKVKLSADNYKQALRSTVIDISFDGTQKVWAPIGDFFCSGYQIESEFEGRYHKLTHDGVMTAKWIMPFQTSAVITIRNLGSEDVTLDTFEANHSDWTWDARSQYFHAGWHNYTNIASQPQRDLNYVNIEGSGTYVGDSLSIYNGTDGFGNQPWWGEGDEKIYVDGESFPSQFGTGTEDYYGYAWVGAATFTYPFLAQPIAHGNRDRGLTVNSRWRILDTIPFNTSLRLDMEIWHWQNVSIDYAPTTFWYGASSTREVVDLTANPTVAFPKDTAGATNPVRFFDVHEAESLKFTESSDIPSTITTIPQAGGAVYRNRTFIDFSDIDGGESLTTSFYSDSARTGVLTISGQKLSGSTTVEILLNGNVISSNFAGTLLLPATDLLEGSNTLQIRGVAASGTDAVIRLDYISLNETNGSIAIMGTNDAIDSTLGVAFSQFNATTRLSDGIFGVDDDTSNVDTTFGGDSSPPSYGYVGLLNIDTDSKLVTGVNLQLACFFDGGWFGPNNNGPGFTGTLDNFDLSVPTIQITTDNGATWSDVAASNNDYLNVLSGSQVGSQFSVNPRYYTVNFPLDTPQTGINGIRVIGLEGGTGDAGFIAAAEFEVQTSDLGAPIAIMGTNDAIDTTRGSLYSQQGLASLGRLNDGTMGVDGDVSNVNTTFGGDNSPPAYGYTGLINLNTNAEIAGLSVQLGCFYDGGWFGPNNNGPGSGGTLANSDLTVPTVQVTTDNGATWANVSSTSNDYTSVMDGAQIGTLNDTNPRYYTVNFPLDTSQRGINGIRLIGLEGGTADAGFIAAAEIELQIIPNDYDNWIDDYDVGDLTSFDDDYDGDGLANGLENFLGTDPSDANMALTMISSNGTTSILEHPQNSSPADDITVTYKWSTNLTNWNNSGDTFEGTTVVMTPTLNTPSTGTTSVEAVASGTLPEQLFFRIEVTLSNSQP